MADLGVIKIRKPFDAYALELGIIGRVGENGMRRIDFDCAEALSEWPDAEIICICLRPGGSSPYSIPLIADKGHRILTLTAAELASPGTLTLELHVVVGDRVLKSARHTGKVLESLWGEGDAPGMPVRDALDRLEAEINTARSLADSIREKMDSGEYKGEKGDKGDKGDTGSDAEVTAENIQGALGYVPAKTPDWSQNDETANDYIKNRPGAYTHTIKGKHIAWDGEIGDRVHITVDDSTTIVKMSDDVFTKADLIGAAITMNVLGNERFAVLSESELMEGEGYVSAEALLWSLPAAKEIALGKEVFSFPEPGTYFMSIGSAYFSSLEFPDKTEDVKIPRKYIEDPSEEEILQELIDADILPALTSEGAILTDEQGNILLW